MYVRKLTFYVMSSGISSYFKQGVAVWMIVFQQGRLTKRLYLPLVNNMSVAASFPPKLSCIKRSGLIAIKSPQMVNFNIAKAQKASPFKTKVSPI